MNANDNDAASDLLIREVDEDLRHEQYRTLWRRYGGLVITGAIAIVVGVAGSQAWQSWRASQKDSASRAFAVAESLIDSDKTDDAIKALGPLESGRESGFAIVAGLRHAALLAERGDTKGAVAEYEAIIGSGEPKLYRDLALLKMAILTVDSADPATLRNRLTPLAQPGSPWRTTASELLALLDRRSRDRAGAAKIYQQLADDLAAPQSVRSRAGEMLTITGPTRPVDTPSVEQPPLDKPSPDKPKG